MIHRPWRLSVIAMLCAGLFVLATTTLSALSPLLIDGTPRAVVAYIFILQSLLSAAMVAGAILAIAALANDATSVDVAAQRLWATPIAVIGALLAGVTGATLVMDSLLNARGAALFDDIGANSGYVLLIIITAAFVLTLGMIGLLFERYAHILLRTYASETKPGQSPLRSP